VEIFPKALDYFQNLLRFNTSNPPGNEKPCIQYISEELRKVGVDSQIFDSAPGRANLVARIKGDGTLKPVHIHSHVDVVQAEEEMWKYPPFSGKIADDCIWGRGAIDMKNMTAYCMATLFALQKEKNQTQARHYHVCCR
jgi:acetylornithine deacetylase/succinyl-diaminopimelate desuccinylase-like protein